MRTSLFILCLLANAFASHGQASSTILFDHGKYGFDYTDLDDIKWKQERSYQILVGQEADLDLLKNISIEINRQAGDQLQGALAINRKMNGSIDTIAQDSFKLQPYDAVFAEYIAQLNDLVVGDTIDVQYTIISKPSTDIIRWDIQHAFPVKQSTFQFIVPEVCIYQDHITDHSFLVAETVLDTTYIIDRNRIPSKGLKIVFQNIPAYVEELFAPDLSETRPAVLFAISDIRLGNTELYMPSWADQVTDLIVGDYFGKQFRVRTNYRWLVDQAQGIFNTRYSEDLMLLKLYEFVHSQFEWDGTYGLYPSHTLQEMQSVKMVNKASMNMALLALLQEAEFKAYPMLVSTIDQPFVYTEIPNLNQFNHFLIAIERGKTIYYLDAGDPLLPIGFVDSAVRHSQAILIKNYKGVWSDIPDFEGKSTMMVNMEVANDLSASGTIQVSFEGYDAQNERHYLNGDPQGLYWKERVRAISPDIRIDSIRFDNVKNLLEPFLNKVYFHIEPSEDQEEMAFYPVFYSFFNQAYFTDSVRINRIVLPSKLKERAIFNITFDNELQVISMPEELKVRMMDGSSEMEFLHSQKNLYAQCTFSIDLNKRLIEPVYYSAVQQYLQQVSDKLNEPVVIGRK